MKKVLILSILFCCYSSFGVELKNDTNKLGLQRPKLGVEFTVIPSVYLNHLGIGVNYKSGKAISLSH